MKLTANDARTRFERSPHAILATADTSARPHLVPVTYVLLAEQAYIAIDAKPKRSTDLKRLRNIAENPQVSLLADEYADDWNRLWWARADGTARIAEFADLPGGLLEAFQERYPWYREHPPEGAVIEVGIEAWSGWAFV